MKRRGKISIFIKPSSFDFVKMKGVVPMLENKFQANLIKELKKRFPGCIVMKNDPTYIQGIPDLLILHKDRWAALECKKRANAKKQPNQEYYFTYEETLPHRKRDYWQMPCSLGADLSQGDDFCAFTFLFPLSNGYSW